MGRADKKPVMQYGPSLFSAGPKRGEAGQVRSRTCTFSIDRAAGRGELVRGIGAFGNFGFFDLDYQSDVVYSWRLLRRTRAVSIDRLMADNH